MVPLPPYKSTHLEVAWDGLGRSHNPVCALWAGFHAKTEREREREREREKERETANAGAQIEISSDRFTSDSC
eukprot:921813-Rhodomonas_salina.1